MAIFKKKAKAIPTAAPEETEPVEEAEYVEKLAEKSKEAPKEFISEPKEIPVCMSRTQLDNMNIETNLMVKYIVSKIEEEQ